MPNIDFPSPATVGQKYTFNGVTYTFTAQSVWSPGSGGGSVPGTISVDYQVAPQGRLTLQQNTPVMLASTTGVTPIYYTPYLGNRIPIFDGTNIAMTTFAEITGSVTDATKNPAVVGNNKVSDWFVWNDTTVPASPVLRLGHGPDWTDDVTRPGGSALTRVQGLFLNTADITNGPKALRGTYVGTTKSNAAGLLDWKFGAGALTGSAAYHHVWNMYNRVDCGSKVSDTTATWSYSINVVRPANNSTNMRVYFVSGLAEDTIQAYYSSVATGLSASTVVGVALDNTTSIFAPTGYSAISSVNILGGSSSLSPMLGAHFFQAVEWSNAGSGCVFSGDQGNGGLLNSGIMFKMRM